MAVNVIRAESPNQEDDIEDDSLPTIQIKSLQVKPPSYFKGHATEGRTNDIYTTEGKPREVVRQENYNRRQTQLTEGGFHGSPGHKYKDVGKVVLDDVTLILQAIGQDKRHSAKLMRTISKQNDSEKLLPDGLGLPPILRSKTSSQFPDQLKSLHLELNNSNAQLNKIRKGYGLFHLIKQEEEMAKKSLEEKIEQEKEQNKLEWCEAAAFSSTHELIDKSIEEETDNVDEVHNTYRMLCVILWVLDGMKLESPLFMPALATYWKITRPQLSNGKRIYERQVQMMNKWEDIVANAQLHSTDTFGSQHKRERRRLRDPKARPLTPGEKMKIEIETLKDQKVLTPDRIERLKLLVEEELDRAKKKARLKIKILMEESAQKHKQQQQISSSKKDLLPVKLDPMETRVAFNKIDESRNMITHEQLTVMSRDRKKALEQRFSSFKVSKGLWEDIGNMRSGVEIESTTMAHNKLMMNYNWISDLHASLPRAVLANRYCKNVLDQLNSLQEYMRQVGPAVMSQENLIQVLSTLHPWQLDSPEVTKAVQFITDHIIYTVPEDYQKWMDYYSSKCASK